MSQNTFIGRKIKEVRDKYKLSQQRFGVKIGISGKTISAYETGKCQPPLKVLEKISSVYNASFLQLKKAKQKHLKDRITVMKDSIKEIEEILDRGMFV